MLLRRNFIFLIVGTILFSLWSQFAYAHGMSEAEKQIIIEGGNLRYITLGGDYIAANHTGK